MNKKLNTKKAMNARKNNNDTVNTIAAINAIKQNAATIAADDEKALNPYYSTIQFQTARRCVIAVVKRALQSTPDDKILRGILSDIYNYSALENVCSENSDDAQTIECTLGNGYDLIQTALLELYERAADAAINPEKLAAALVTVKPQSVNNPTGFVYCINGYEIETARRALYGVVSKAIYSAKAKQATKEVKTIVDGKETKKRIPVTVPGLALAAAMETPTANSFDGADREQQNELDMIAAYMDLQLALSDETQREIVLYIVQGYTQKEIAAALKKSQGFVSKQYTAAKRILAAHYHVV